MKISQTQQRGKELCSASPLTIKLHSSQQRCKLNQNTTEARKNCMSPSCKRNLSWKKKVYLHYITDMELN
jgi:hypothetical protein